MIKAKSQKISDIKQQFFFAIKQKDDTLVQELLKQNAEVNYKSPHDRYETPLMLAARVGDIGIAKLLIEAKANLNIKTLYGHKAADLAESAELQKLLTP